MTKAISDQTNITYTYAFAFGLSLGLGMAYSEICYSAFHSFFLVSLEVTEPAYDLCHFINAL